MSFSYHDFSDLFWQQLVFFCEAIKIRQHLYNVNAFICIHIQAHFCAYTTKDQTFVIQHQHVIYFFCKYVSALDPSQMTTKRQLLTIA